MRYLVLLVIATFLGGCGAVSRPAQADKQLGLSSFPTPGQLARHAKPRVASGTDSEMVRLLQSEGALYVPWPNYSSNAEVSGSDALIHATDDNLSYVLFQVGTPLVDNTDTLSDLLLDFEWTTLPSDPEGLYIGLPDHVADRWVWLNAADANGSVLSIAELAIHGANPVSQPNGSFIAVVNYSDSDVTLHSIALRFDTSDSVDGDEWLYFTEQPESTPAGISRISPQTTELEPILVGEGTLPDMIEYGVPQVADYGGTWKLDYARAGGMPPQLWRCDLDGTNQVVLHDEPGAAYNPVGHLDGTERGLFIGVSGGPVYELRASNGIDEGRLSRATDMVFGATWDLSLDSGIEYGAIAVLAADTVNYYGDLVRFYGSGPFPIDATPEALYVRLPTESAADPDMMEYATLAGDPRYYVYFAARNRDDATYNLYRIAYPGGQPEPVLVDPTYEFHYPCVSPDGRWLAYVRQPAGSTSYTLGELMLADLLNPAAGSEVLATNALYELSWYDPAP